MKVARKPSGETVILTSTAANRGLGIFLVFLGLVGAAPVWYLIRAWTSVIPQTRNDWYPAVIAGACLALVGFVLAVHARKKIIVGPDGVHVHDGFFARPLHFRWTGAPTIRLQHVERGEGVRRKVTWLVKLVSARSEYTVDARTDQQLESRALAEAMAKALHCPMKERTDDSAQLVIDPADLDLPFRERVKKYPALIGKPMERPAGVPLRTRVSEDGTEVRYSWSLIGPTFILDVLVLGLVFFVLAVIPESPQQQSLWEAARRTHDYRLYIWVAAVIVGVLVFIAGLRVHLDLGPTHARYRQTLFFIPLTSRSISHEEIEEVQLFYSVRGPRVQIVSDRSMLSVQVGDAELASWLAFEIRCFLMHREAGRCGIKSSCIPPPAGTTQTPR